MEKAHNQWFILTPTQITPGNNLVHLGGECKLFCVTVVLR